MSTAPSQRTKVRRKPARAHYDREAIEAILDEAMVAHLGYTDEGQTYVIPTLHARVGEEVYFHGSAAVPDPRLADGIALTPTVGDWTPQRT